jgi:hypothetical protein
MSLNFKPAYGTTEGPLGFPLTDRQAFAVDAILRGLPKDQSFAYRKAVIERGPTELLPGDRADVSWISTEDPDRCGDVVIARGMNDSQFKLNPIVTLNHCYRQPPVGRSLWRKLVKEGDLRGIKAKTIYPARPADWAGDWPADIAFSLVQADLLRGKSIGFLPVKVHVPADKEMRERGWTKVGLVIDEWILLEYACVFLPAQQNAVVESVSKSLPPIPWAIREALGLSEDDARISQPHESDPVAFTLMSTIAQAAQQRLEEIDPVELAERAVSDRLDRLRGRV